MPLVRTLEDTRRGAVQAGSVLTSKGQGARMTEKTEEEKKRDYSCEILSFIVLVILSALSHFWYIVIAMGIGIIFWFAIALLGQLLVSAHIWLPSHSPSREPNGHRAGDSGTQVFLPRKIRQSVDC
jgi:hypothetical protein